jgi:hypothetical protein
VNGVLAELASGGGCRYEAAVLRAIKAAGVAGQIRRANCTNAVAPDADMRVGGTVHRVEVKANTHAQMGGGSVGYSGREFRPVGMDQEVSGLMVDALDAAPDVDGLMDALDALVAFVARKTRGRDVSGFPMSGFTAETWEAAAERGLLRPVNRSIDADVSAIEAHYAAKGIGYIQIGGAGLFRLGSANPAGLPVPRLRGTVKLELRAAKAGDAGRPTSKAGLRVQCRLGSVGSSPHTLDDPGSVKRMLAAAA